MAFHLECTTSAKGGLDFNTWGEKKTKKQTTKKPQTTKQTDIEVAITGTYSSAGSCIVFVGLSNFNKQFSVMGVLLMTKAGATFPSHVSTVVRGQSSPLPFCIITLILRRISATWFLCNLSYYPMQLQLKNRFKIISGIEAFRECDSLSFIFLGKQRCQGFPDGVRKNNVKITQGSSVVSYRYYSSRYYIILAIFCKNESLHFIMPAFSQCFQTTVYAFLRVSWERTHAHTQKGNISKYSNKISHKIDFQDKVLPGYSYIPYCLQQSHSPQ